MVEVPTPSASPTPKSGGDLSSFRNNKRIPEDSYKSYLMWAIAVDLLLCWLPGAGDAFIAYCRGMWWLNGYNTDKMTTTTIMNAIGELVPFVPSSTIFVWISYRINKANTKTPEEEVAEEKKTQSERAQVFAFQYIGGKAGTGTPEPQNKSPEPKQKPETERAPATEPHASTLENKNVDTGRGKTLENKDEKTPKTANLNETKKPKYQERQPAFKRQADQENAVTPQRNRENEAESGALLTSNNNEPSTEGEDGENEDRFDDVRLVA